MTKFAKLFTESCQRVQVLNFERREVANNSVFKNIVLSPVEIEGDWLGIWTEERLAGGHFTVEIGCVMVTSSAVSFNCENSTLLLFSFNSKVLWEHYCAFGQIAGSFDNRFSDRTVFEEQFFEALNYSWDDRNKSGATIKIVPKLRTQASSTKCFEMSEARKLLANASESANLVVKFITVSRF